MQTVGGADIIRLGLAELDLDNDGVVDFICGMEDGQLAYYRNQGSNTNLIFANPVSLTDTFETPISVGENSWPTEFDWDGDGDFDLLVGEQTGKIYILENQGGQFTIIGNLSAEDWDPLDLTPGVVGGVCYPLRWMPLISMAIIWSMSWEEGTALPVSGILKTQAHHPRRLSLPMSFP